MKKHPFGCFFGRSGQEDEAYENTVKSEVPEWIKNIDASLKEQSEMRNTLRQYSNKKANVAERVVVKNGKDGKKTRITEIESIENGVMTVRLADDTTGTVGGSEGTITFADERSRILYNAASKMGTPADARAFILGYVQNGVSGKVSVKEYAKEYERVYNLGLEGKEASYDSDVLTREQWQLAYSSGNALNRKVVKSGGHEIQVNGKADIENAKSGVTRAYTNEGKQNYKDNAKLEATEIILDEYGKKHNIKYILVDNIQAVKSENKKQAANAMYAGGNTVYIALDSENPLLVAAGHETFHYIKKASAEMAQELQAFVIEKLKNDKHFDYDERYKRLQELYGYEDVDAIEEELTANCMFDVIANEETVTELYKEHNSLFEKLKAYLGNIIADIKSCVKKYLGSNKEAAAIGRNIKTVEKIRDMFNAAVEKAKTEEDEKRKTENGKLSLNEKFEEQYDNWDKTNPRIKFTVGDTSSVLQSLGVPRQKITWDASKIIKIKAKHKEMTDTIIKQVPNIIENPIVVMQSKSAEGRLTLFGEVFSGKKPILAVLELNSTDRHGLMLDEIKIASAYGKDNTQKFINSSIALYVDANKKRVSEWEKRTGLQLPVGISVPNSNNSIMQSSTNVNNNSMQGGGKNTEKFSLAENAEETKELVAVHNLTEDGLLGTLRLGGLPMPSIAIIKAKDGHSMYGPISLVFNKDSIDPENSSLNKVYGLDVWSPTYPTVEYKPNDDVVKGIKDKYYELSRKFGYDITRPMYTLANEPERALNGEYGEKGLIEKLYDDTGMMQLFLADSGKETVADVFKEIRTEMNDSDREIAQFIIEYLGQDKVDEYKNVPSNVTPMGHRRKFIADNP